MFEAINIFGTSVNRVLERLWTTISLLFCLNNKDSTYNLFKTQMTLILIHLAKSIYNQLLNKGVVYYLYSSYFLLLRP